jgi:hypothetical protein
MEAQRAAFITCRACKKTYQQALAAAALQQRKQQQGWARSSLYLPWLGCAASPLT